MKNWAKPEVCVLNVSATAFGPTNPDKVDEAKYAVKAEDGTILGWEQLYGEPEKQS